nr:exosome RNA helicase MTR4 [Seculamonas ecuadoriensis]
MCMGTHCCCFSRLSLDFRVHVHTRSPPLVSTRLASFERLSPLRNPPSFRLSVRPVLRVLSPLFTSSILPGLFFVVCSAAASTSGASDGTSSAPSERVVIEPTEELKKIFTSRSECLHKISLPPDYTGPDPREVIAAVTRPPAKTYKFELDAFQRTSVEALEAGQSVLVSAHTSAGKTAVAEYAIAMSLRDQQRVIYTSPIKALSNQKYRELNEEFKDVGLMTGDVTINPNASCLVMTTEILRSMLYRGSEILREVAWVIFDEIHYMRDKERGVVWEETIILLPDKVRFVFLSATIPNAQEFADWVAKLHSQPVHVVYTEYRPTPLQHYIYPSGAEGVYLIVDEKGKFREDNFAKALSSLSEDKSKDAKKKPTKGPSDVQRLIRMVLERRFDPVIVFSFSKRECEALAMQLSKLDFADDNEKQLISHIFNSAIEGLAEEDRSLPQITNLLPLLKRGIGIHHGGLLPLLKEIVELMFQEGLLKVLFSTETFSMGLNMPAKTVVFTNLRKFDGQEFRWISGGEYVQMSGRAGRRGLDDRGIVIMMVDDKIDTPTAKNMLNGRADPLNSQFHLSYNMLLNLLRIEAIDIEYLMVRSFHQFQSERARPEMLKSLDELREEIVSIQIDNESVVADYYALRSHIDKYRKVIRSIIMQPKYALPFLAAGRLVHVEDGDQDFGWGVVVNFQKKTADKATPNAEIAYVVDVVLRCTVDDTGNPRPVLNGAKGGEMHVLPLPLSSLSSLSSIRIYLPRDLRNAESRAAVMASLDEVKKRFPDGVPELDGIEDMGIDEESLRVAMRKSETLESKLASNAAFAPTPALQSAYAKYSHKVALENKMKQLKKLVRASEEVVMREDLKCMKRVLRRLGHTNAENVIQKKGRVACEINTADELLITELMFNGVFNNLTVEQTVALLSCFVAAEKSDDEIRLREELATPYRSLTDTAKRIAQVFNECKIAIDVDEYVQSFRPAMMELVFAWCKGAKFADICKMTSIFEGSIIRALRRLEELLRQLASAAKAVGDDQLETKFEAGMTAIRRDIVFAASLYL